MKLAFLLLPLVCLMPGGSINADTILMKNGDRISGEIKKMWDNEILIDPAYADEFNVKLAHVSSIETDSELDVELEDGTEGDYLLVSSSEEGYVILKSGESEISVTLQGIRKVAEIEEYFKWDTKADINQSVSRGNTDSDTVNFNYDIYKDIYLNVQLNYDYNTEPAEGTENANLTYLFGAGLKF